MSRRVRIDPPGGLAAPSWRAVPPHRQRAGWLVVLVGLPLLTVALANLRDAFSLPSQLLLYLLLVVVAAAVGGIGPAALAAVLGSLTANWYFTPPHHDLSIAHGENALALGVFLVVGLLVSLLVIQASARTAEATVLSRADDLRVSLLRAVSHDLRSPLASIKASVTSLLQRDVEWTEAATLEFLGTIDEESDRLDALVGNLLDMSRLQAGAVAPDARPVGYEEVLPAALASLSVPTGNVHIALDETLPRVQADPALLERAVANLTVNAIEASGPRQQIRVEAAATARRIELRIVDHGSGIPHADRSRLFEPFQRLGDTGHGVGLGLAVARGFIEAMGGEVRVEDTPGGGVTMVVAMPEADER